MRQKARREEQVKTHQRRRQLWSKQLGKMQTTAVEVSGSSSFSVATQMDYQLRRLDIRRKGYVRLELFEKVSEQKISWNQIARCLM